MLGHLPVLHLVDLTGEHVAVDVRPAHTLVRIAQDLFVTIIATHPTGLGQHQPIVH